jgi:hypothetical protein
MCYMGCGFLRATQCNMADAPDFKSGLEKLASTATTALASMQEIQDRTSELNFPPPQLVELPKAGRRKGPTPETTYLVGALKRQLAAADDGAEPTPIAVGIFKALGFEGEQLKSKADHLVKALKKTP